MNNNIGDDEIILKSIKEQKPAHIAFILDGNRRWARERNLPVSLGHKKGAENAKNLFEWCIKYEIKYLTIYCLSVDNLQRSEEELNGIFSLLKQYLLPKNIEEINEKGVDVEVIGDLEILPDDVANAIKKIDKIHSAKDIKLHLQVCIGYGGRNEIVNATKAIAEDIQKEIIKKDDINDKLFEKYLFTKNIPDVDLMIRSGSETRISDFLLWKLAYSELYFCDKWFPDFNEHDFLLALYFFSNKKRRYGR